MTAKPMKGVHVSRKGGRLLIRRREFSPSAAALLIFTTIWNSFLLLTPERLNSPGTVTATGMEAIRHPVIVETAKTAEPIRPAVKILFALSIINLLFEMFIT